MSNFFNRIRNWEQWPFWLRYLNITPMWMLYGLRARSPWFFTPSNPTLTFGGFEGESKREMYEQLPPGSFPDTIYITPGIPFAQVREQVEQSPIRLPFIVKPDVGMAGILFRKIFSFEELEAYHAKMPVDYLVQALIPYPVEFSIFYYRYPGQEQGVITGFLQKEPMSVTGDGSSTLLQLIEQHPNARFRVEEMRQKHDVTRVLPAGEKFFLTYAANLNRGGVFYNLHREIDPTLVRLMDGINLYSKEFYYGRYDLKAASLEDLRAGKNFLLLEYNGSGAEPNHVYQQNMTLRAAHREILRHWKVLYEISMINRRNGIPVWPLRKGWRFLQGSKAHFKLLKQLDEQI
ncbi:ATP-grasp domain-containing protein [Flaviaesturariibacter terrae]